jgi:prepilin-type N-terminal cleavage/methylation domain-containing protein
MPRFAPHRREGGFTMIEMLIVLIIISILVAAAWKAMVGAKVATRVEAMETATAQIDSAFGTFNRMYPPIGADPFQQLQASSTPMTANPTPGQAPPANRRYLADETNEPLMNAWPKNPYSTGGVRVFVYTSPAQCAGIGQPGDIRVCRMGGANGAQTYTITGYAKDKTGASVVVYTASHGQRSGGPN